MVTKATWWPLATSGGAMPEHGNETVPEWNGDPAAFEALVRYHVLPRLTFCEHLPIARFLWMTWLEPEAPSRSNNIHHHWHCGYPAKLSDRWIWWDSIWAGWYLSEAKAITSTSTTRWKEKGGRTFTAWRRRRWHGWFSWSWTTSSINRNFGTSATITRTWMAHRCLRPQVQHRTQRRDACYLVDMVDIIEINKELSSSTADKLDIVRWYPILKMIIQIPLQQARRRSTSCERCERGHFCGDWHPHDDGGLQVALAVGPRRTKSAKGQVRNL